MLFGLQWTLLLGSIFSTIELFVTAGPGLMAAD